MKKGDRFTPTTSSVLPLHVPPEMIAQIGQYGDIVTLGSKEIPAREWRTGIPVPHDQIFMLTRPE